MKMRFRKIMAAILSTAMVAAAIPASGILNVQAKSPQEHIDLSRQVAGEGMVLMENDGALPLAQGEKVAMFGRAMIDYVRGGGGSGGEWTSEGGRTRRKSSVSSNRRGAFPLPKRRV